MTSTRFAYKWNLDIHDGYKIINVDQHIIARVHKSLFPQKGTTFYYYKLNKHQYMSVWAFISIDQAKEIVEKAIKDAGIILIDEKYKVLL